MNHVLVSAGDVSGDMHAADFVTALRERLPRCRFIGMGGAEMARAGVELVNEPSDLGVGGIVGLAGGVASLVRCWRRLSASLRQVEPDLVVLVDSGGFNLAFARHVRRHLRVPILYYVAPQVWAWRPGRMPKLAQRADRLAVILPFEREIWKGQSLPVDWVGHPLVDRLGAAALELSRDEARARLGIGPLPRIVALLPGSRRREVEHQLPIQLETARCLHARDAEIGFVIVRAASLAEARMRTLLRRARLPRTLRIECVAGRAHEAMRAADVVLTKPGTATVECLLLERPMVVMGRVDRLTAAVLRRRLRVSWLAMPNLIARREIVPEFLQERASPADLATALSRLMRGPARQQQLEDLAAVRGQLGAGGAARRVAALAEEMLGHAAA